MRDYEFHFYDAIGRRPTRDVLPCADDATATREAFRQIRQHGSCRGVEVYAGKRMVLRLEKPAAQILAPGLGLHGAG